MTQKKAEIEISHKSERTILEKEAYFEEKTFESLHKTSKRKQF